MSKRRKRTPWQITSTSAPTERTNEQRLDDMLEVATQITEWAAKTPCNALHAEEIRARRPTASARSASPHPA